MRLVNTDQCKLNDIKLMLCINALRNVNEIHSEIATLCKYNFIAKTFYNHLLLHLFLNQNRLVKYKCGGFIRTIEI